MAQVVTIAGEDIRAGDAVCISGDGKVYKLAPAYARVSLEESCPPTEKDPSVYHSNGRAKKGGKS